MALVFCFSPFLGAILSYFFWKERLTLLKILGLGLGLIGMFILFYPRYDTSLAFNYNDLWLLGAMVATTLGWTFVKILVFLLATLKSF